MVLAEGRLLVEMYNLLLVVVGLVAAILLCLYSSLGWNSDFLVNHSMLIPQTVAIVSLINLVALLKLWNLGSASPLVLSFAHI